MHPTLLKALEKARNHIASYMNPVQNQVEEQRKELKKLSKDQLIDLIVGEIKPNFKLEDVIYSILEDPDCAWLTWEAIAALITSYIPESKTTANSLKWYPSEGAKKGKNIVQRKRTKEIAALLMQ